MSDIVDCLLAKPSEIPECIINVQDCGFSSLTTDNDSLVLNENEVYIILDASVDMCCIILRCREADLNEKYHTFKDLTYYRQRFIEVSEKWDIKMISAEIHPICICDEIMKYLKTKNIS